MFAEIVIHRRLPKGLESFTYEVPQDLILEIGQLVQVPFRKKKLSGVVRKIHGAIPAYPTKFIEKAIPIILLPWQIELANWMSNFYQCSFAKVIDLFFPEKIWKGKIEKLRIEKMKPLIKKNKRKNEESVIDTMIKKLIASPAKKFVLEKTSLPRENFYHALEKNLPRNSQILFLFPEFFHIKQLMPGFSIFHGGMKEKEKASVWEAVRKRKIHCIAGTRTAIFLPFQKLSCIVVDFEENESYREKRQPHYHAVEVAEKIAEHWKIPLIVVSTSPRVETYYRYEKFVWGEKKAAIPIKIIDMEDEKKKGNFGIFAMEIIEKMARCLTQNKQILLFLNRKGQASALFCRDCGEVFRCSKCASPLTLHGEKELQCHRCQLKEKTPKQCKKCGNVKLKPLGIGTEKVEKEIQKLFAKAKILRLDRETKRNSKWSEFDIKKLASPDILIATQIIDKPLLLRHLYLTIVVSADNLLNFPFFRATEQTFQLLTHLKHLTKGEMFIQTFLPKHALYNCLSQNNIEKFYEEELETRKNLSLPPFNITLP